MEADPVRMGRLVDHLLANAVKDSPVGSEIRVRLATQEEAGRPWAVLAIAGQSHGTHAVRLLHLTERFSHSGGVAGTTTGDGMGLAIAQQTVELHGGDIHVHSTEGQDTTVTVRLPLD